MVNNVINHLCDQRDHADHQRNLIHGVILYFTSATGKSKRKGSEIVHTLIDSTSKGLPGDESGESLFSRFSVGELELKLT